MKRPEILKLSKFATLALAGLLAGSLTGCKKDSPTSTNDGITYDTSGGTGDAALASFKMACETNPTKKAMEHSCNGLNSCKGESFFVGKGKYSHDCTGKAECAGATCVDKT